jgi:hypothetical protein
VEITPIPFAIDVDNTLTRYPAQMKQLLLSNPNNVFLTGHNTSTGMQNPEELQAFRRKQITEYIGEFDNRIIIVTGADGPAIAKAKGEYCRDANVQIFIDDDEGFCQFVRHYSPTTVVLRVMP